MTSAQPQSVNNNLENSEEYRVMPHNIEAEQTVLGALLVNNRNLEKVSEFLREEQFYNSVHGRIFGAISKLVERGQDASPVTLKNYFDQDEALAHLGGAQYLTDLASNIFSVVDIDAFAKQVYELHLRRALIAMGEDVVNDAYKHDIDHSPLRQIEVAEKSLYELATAGDIQGGFVSLGDSVVEAIKTAESAFQNQGSVTGATTGLVDLDKKLGGLHDSDLLILAGRPSMGKSTLAMNIAFNAARAYVESNGQEGAISAVFSLEMSSDQLAGRLLSDVSNVPSDKIRKGELKDTDFHKFVEASQIMAQTPLYIDDTPAVTIGALRTRCRRLKRQSGLGLVIIDYLQLMQGSGRSSDNRVQEVSEITRGLKALAKELHVPVIALSQLSRQVENRDNKRPQLSDLRESGSIEQDADSVMFVYREEYYLERDEPARKPEESEERFNERYEAWAQRLQEVANVAECIIAKQRHGPIGTVRMFFEGQFTRFTDLDEHHAAAYGNPDAEE